MFLVPLYKNFGIKVLCVMILDEKKWRIIIFHDFLNVKTVFVNKNAIRYERVFVRICKIYFPKL